jgi:hypothetical protein
MLDWDKPKAKVFSKFRVFVYSNKPDAIYIGSFRLVETEKILGVRDK